MAKLKLKTVTKEIEDERLVADYISAGWELVKETKAKINNETQEKEPVK